MAKGVGSAIGVWLRGNGKFGSWDLRIESEINLLRVRARVANKEHLVLLRQGIDAGNQWRRRLQEELGIEPDFSQAYFGEAYFHLLRQGVDNWNQWRQENPMIEPDLSQANLSQVYVRGANLSQANLRRADLREADLRGANLKGADLRGAFLLKACFRGANLTDTNFSQAFLSYADFIQANFRGANLSCAYVNNANLSDTDLSNTNFSRADLSQADLSRANLSGANLSETLMVASQLLESNLNSSILTGACIQDWNINNVTQMDNVLCNYVYKRHEWLDQEKKYIPSDRRPSDPDSIFAPGEFAKLFQKALETVDLIFTDGIDWKAFFQSFQELRSRYGDKNIAIQAIEKKSGGSFVIRLEVSPEADKAQIESEFKVVYAKLALLEERVTEYKDEVRSLRQSNANLERIVITMADKDISKVTQHFNAPVTAVAGNIEGNQIIYSPEQRQTLAEAAAEIQKLLDQLSQTYPTNTTTGKMQLAAVAIAQIENNSTLMQRVLSAIQAGGTAALEQFLNHPAASFVIGAMEDWNQTKEN